MSKVEKTEEFEQSGMTLITETESEKFLEKYRELEKDAHSGKDSSLGTK